MTSELSSNASVRPEEAVEVCGRGTDETGAYFVQLSVNGRKITAIPFSIISNKDSFFSPLNAAGAKLFQQSSRRKLLAKIESASPADTFKVATRLGCASFVLRRRARG